MPSRDITTAFLKYREALRLVFNCFFRGREDASISAAALERVLFAELVNTSYNDLRGFSMSKLDDIYALRFKVKSYYGILARKRNDDWQWNPAGEIGDIDGFFFYELMDFASDEDNGFRDYAWVHLRNATDELLIPVLSCIVEVREA